jgi:hypothetical protein
MSAIVERVTRIDADRAVAKLTVDDFHFGSIFVTGLTTEPKVSWPKTARGFPIIECRSPDKRAELERLILDAVL